MYAVGQWLWDKEKGQPVQYLGYGLKNKEDKHFTTALAEIVDGKIKIRELVYPETLTGRYHEMYAFGRHKDILI